MGEILLRAKAIIGSLKLIAGGVLFVAGVIFVMFSVRLTTTLKNPRDPQPITLEQLMEGTAGQHIATQGYAWYEAAYTYESEDGVVISSYYYLYDDLARYAIVVKSSSATLYGRISGYATVSGMTHSTPADLRKLIEEDVPSLRENGFETNPRLYIEEGDRPPDMVSTVATLVAAGIAVVLCLAVFLFPATVFKPMPLPEIDTPIPEHERSGIRASGRFLRLRQVQPTIEIGRGTRSFKNAIANIVPLAEQKLMIYIHHILRSKVYGVTVSTTMTDWGVFLDSGNITGIETGKLYGWRDRWGVRFRYTGPKDREENLILGFDRKWAPGQFIKLLQKMGVHLAGYLQ